MRFSMLYSGEQILSFKSCLVFYAGDSLNPVNVQTCTPLMRKSCYCIDRFDVCKLSSTL